MLMRARTWLPISIALNVALAAAWLGPKMRTQPSPPSPQETSAQSNRQVEVKTNVLVRRLNFTWQEVESDDYATYIKNLRQIGCPEQTIRDIIVADVDQLYAFRRSEEAASTDFQWWRSQPDSEAIKKRNERLRSLESERRALLTRLLGEGWDTRLVTNPPPSRYGVNLNGPVLGDLSAETKDKVYDVVRRGRERIETYLADQKKLNAEPNPGEVVRLRQQFRSELATLLNAEQMEEFLLRYSQTAIDMRREYRSLNLTADEFRQIFRERDSVEQEKGLLVGQQDLAGRQRLAALNTHLESAVQQSVGRDRYAEFKLNQDPLFGQTKAMAERIGTTPEVMLGMYEITQVTEAERQRIRSDTTLTPEQKIQALAEVQADQQTSLRELLGDQGFERWLDLQERK